MEWIAKLDQAFALGKISSESCSNIHKWLENKEYDSFVSQIGDMIEADQWTELDDCFFKMIEFGTGGRRGPRGPGPNRINDRTIAESAQGLSDYIHENGDPAKGVVVAFDTRHQSSEYAEEVCRVLTGNNIKTYLYRSPRSTPQLSFSIRHLQTQAGCMISASHNPPSDNGIKVSWVDGGQVLPPHDKGIIRKVADVSSIQRMSIDSAVQQNRLVYLDSRIDNAYLVQLKSLALSEARGAKIAYSPLHGVGATNVVKLLHALHFNLVTLASQMTPDPNFSTVKNQLPNPELPAAMELVTRLASESGAVLAMASDPDADRLGVTIPCPVSVDPSGWLFLTGNQIAVLILDHVLRCMHRTGQLVPGGVVVSTIVTTDMLDALCKQYKVKIIKDLLVGFKYIAEVVNSLPSSQYLVFATEESHGFNRGTFVRDKDSAPAALHMAELACELIEEGSTIYEHLNGLYRRHGYFCEVTRSVYYEGKAGLETMLRIMEKLRGDPPTEISGKKVYRITDRSTNIIIDPDTRTEIGKINQHKGNVLIFWLSEDGRDRITARPSGTEPKIKFYAQKWHPVSADLSEPGLEELKQQVKRQAISMIDALAGLGG